MYLSILFLLHVIQYCSNLYLYTQIAKQQQAKNSIIKFEQAH